MRWSLLGLFLLVLAACKKDDFSLSTTEVALPVGDRVRCIEEVEDGFLVAGGEVNGSGFVCHLSRDLRQIDLLTVAIGHEVHDLTRWNGRWYFGTDSSFLWFTDDLDQYSPYYFSEEDWIVDLYKQPWRRFAKTDHALLGACGGNNSFGALFQSFDSTQSWNPKVYDHELRTAFCLPGGGFRAWAAGNGILMRLDEPAGEWERIRLDNSLIADLHFWNRNDGLALEYDGNVMRTMDGGDTWKQVASGATWRFMNRLAADGVESDRLRAEAGRGRDRNRGGHALRIPDGPFEHLHATH